MRIYLWLILILGFLSSGSALAQTDLTGTWQGTMEITPEQKLTIQFVITKKDDGSYAAVLNSPDTGAIKDIAAESVTYKDGKLDIEVQSLSGSYSGKIADNVITGEWKQPGSALKLVLTPYVKPKEVPTDPLLGEWVGPIDVGMKLTIVLKYNKDKDGKFSGTIDIPEQGANGLPLGEVTLAGDEANFDVPAARIKFRCKLDGDTLKGHLIQGTQEIPIEFKKGKYVPPPKMLDVSAEAMKKLKGEWTGKMTLVEGLPLPVRVRFEETKEGKSRAFLDIPSQNQKDMPLSDVELKGDKLSLKVGMPRYEGTLKDDVISGQYIIANMKFALNLTRGAKLEELVPEINIPEDIMKKLSGRWKGKIGNANVAITFKVDDSGKNQVLIENIDQKSPASPFLRGSVTGNALSLKEPTSELSGELKDEKIEGVFKTFGSVIPVTFEKEK